MNKIVIGISGGVDSSVAAYLLKKQGFEVIGITFRFIDNFDAESAIKVCKQLNIEHHIVDYRKEFKEMIIDRFINEYKMGLTPNPCIICNRDIKINYLYQEMIKYNADFIATGHYAKLENNKLYKSIDLNKDQTYFLSLVKKEQLSKLILPLEGIDKTEVRKIADSINLITSNKKDSYDVCFIDKNFRDFIKENINNNEGNVINIKDNKIIGKHKGLSYYTIGQRRGLNIGGTEDRMFVVGKDTTKNILYVAIGDENTYLMSDSCILKEVNFISDKRPNTCNAKFRYRQIENEVELEYLENNEILVKFKNNIKSVTPGQACTMYIGNECIGGGIIKEVRKVGEKVWYL